MIVGTGTWPAVTARVAVGPTPQVEFVPVTVTLPEVHPKFTVMELVLFKKLFPQKIAANIQEYTKIYHWELLLIWITFKSIIKQELNSVSNEII